MSTYGEQELSRFWSKVDRRGKDGCWVWTAYKDAFGRGQIHWRGRTRMAHKVSAELAGISVPAEMVICHRCDNPACVNPAHFFVGSQADNMADMWRKGRGVMPSNPRGSFLHPRALVERVLSMRGRPQREIAELVGMSQPNVSRILSGQLRCDQ